MAAISYKPIPEVVAGLARYARSAGFKKVGTRFRRAVDGQHGLVLHGEDAFAWRDDHYREGSWALSVCFGPWVDVIQKRNGKPIVSDPMKFDPTRHSIVEFRPKARPNPAGDPRRSVLGYYADDPADIADYVDHVGNWFERVAFPLAEEWLADPQQFLQPLEEQRAHYDRHPSTDVYIGGSDKRAQAIVLRAHAGDLARARADFDEVKAQAEGGDWFWKSYVGPLSDVLATGIG